MEGVGDAREVDVDVWGDDVFNVERDDLLFEDEEVLDEEQMAVGARMIGGDECRGVV